MGIWSMVEAWAITLVAYWSTNAWRCERLEKETGFSFLTRVEEQVTGFKIFALKQNHRHDIVAPILKVYQDFRD